MASWSLAPAGEAIPQFQDACWWWCSCGAPPQADRGSLNVVDVSSHSLLDRASIDGEAHAAFVNRAGSATMTRPCVKVCAWLESLYVTERASSCGRVVWRCSGSTPQPRFLAGLRRCSSVTSEMATALQAPHPVALLAGQESSQPDIRRMTWWSRLKTGRVGHEIGRPPCYAIPNAWVQPAHLQNA